MYRGWLATLTNVCTKLANPFSISSILVTRMMINWLMICGRKCSGAMVTPSARCELDSKHTSGIRVTEGDSDDSRERELVRNCDSSSLVSKADLIKYCHTIGNEKMNAVASDLAPVLDNFKSDSSFVLCSSHIVLPPLLFNLLSQTFTMNATLPEPTTMCISALIRSSPLDISQVISHSTLLVQADYFNRVIFMIAIAILYFEFALTFPLEVERFWGRPSGWASTLFYINRYTSIIFHLPVLYKYFWALLIVRTYALYDCNRKVAIFLSSIAIFGGILGGWSITQTRGSAYDPLNAAAQWYDHGCLQVLSRSQGAHYAIPWIVALVFDTTVFALTLSRALKFGLAWRSGLFYIILRDGTIYFG
ncbi:hypothetical protein C8Q74DRAFT_1393942 [Fomes fomentarius]|nr:hypothetical protein C8Q74DRAFT_1393942 [Fomes fomentarius]